MCVGFWLSGARLRVQGLFGARGLEIMVLAHRV